MTCSNTVKSQFNRLYSVCSKVQSSSCGKTLVNLQSVGASDRINITSLAVGQSCSYKVMTKCGLPAFDINNTNIDVTVIQQQGKDENTDFNANDTIPDSDTAIIKPRDGQIKYTFGNNTEKDSTCDKMRKMFVTITNVAPSANATRILQTSSSLSINFYSTDGSASSFANIIKGFSAVVMAAMMLALF
jgi:hypothetical protein